MLKVEHMTLRFGELIANNDVSLEIPDHKVVAMIGPNGAGKTTCFNCISGVYNADTGSIELNGKSIKGKQPYQIHNMGLSRTYQIINLFADMSVIDNVIVAMHADLKANFFDSLLHTKRHRTEEKEAYARAGASGVHGPEPVCKRAGRKPPVWSAAPRGNHARARQQPEPSAARRAGSRHEQ